MFVPKTVSFNQLLFSTSANFSHEVQVSLNPLQEKGTTALVKILKFFGNLPDKGRTALSKVGISGLFSVLMWTKRRVAPLMKVRYICRVLEFG